MNKNPTRIEAALHVYDAMLADAEEKVRDILARGGVPGATLDKVIARDRRRLAHAAERERRCKAKEPATIDKADRGPRYSLTPEQQAVIDEQHDAALRRLGLRTAEVAQ